MNKPCLKLIWKNRNYFVRTYSKNILGVEKLKKPISGFQRSYTLPSGTPGSGAGKGGGAGGSVKEAGGGLGKFAAAQEEGYFYNLDRVQMEKLKQKLKNKPQQSQEQPSQKPTDT